jgi:DNA-binding HxlR family transcriptional regulator
MKALTKALELETKGLKRRGKSAYSIAKEQYSLTGNKMTVLEKLNALYKAEKEMWK